MTRRDFLWAGSAAGSLASLRAQELEPLNRYPHLVHEWFVDQVREAQAARLERFEALRTAEDAEAYVRSVRDRIAESFGPMPERTPLNPRITGSFERESYRVENVIFDSRPDFPVTANLYLPKRPGKLPGVVGTCGHSANGKAAEAYQSFAQGLARQGYVVLLYDPIGQGERLQYLDDDLQPTVGPGTREHLLAGNQQFLVGDFIGSWRAWDGIRALDYLLTREEVDPSHLGVTGNSGGGTMTTWLCGVEPRWTMAAPSCFVTTFRRNLENELPADTEQCPPQAIALGLDHEDFLAAMAPRPVIILAKEKDYFDARGTEEAFWRLKRLWGLLGAEDNLGLFIGPTYHGYSRENREAMYGWFNRATGVSDLEGEPPLAIEADETLHCVKGGQVGALKPRTVFSFTREKAGGLASQRMRLSAGGLAEAVAQQLRIAARPRPPYTRILRNRSDREYPKPQAVFYAVETEPGIQAIVTRLSDEPLLSRPPRGSSRATLYVSHHSADQELREEPLVRELIEADPKRPFFAMDVRGVGETRPDTTRPDSFLLHYGSDYFYAVHSLMLDRPYVGQKTFDVLSVMAWLARYGHSEIHLAATGWGTFPAQFAALFSDQVVQVTLKGALESYRAVAESERYDWPLSSFAPGVLEHFDLPEVRAALETKNLRVIDLRGARL